MIFWILNKILNNKVLNNLVLYQEFVPIQHIYIVMSEKEFDTFCQKAYDKLNLGQKLEYVASGKPPFPVGSCQHGELKDRIGVYTLHILKHLGVYTRDFIYTINILNTFESETPEKTKYEKEFKEFLQNVFDNKLNLDQMITYLAKGEPEFPIYALHNNPKKRNFVYHLYLFEYLEINNVLLDTFKLWHELSSLSINTNTLT